MCGITGFYRQSGIRGSDQAVLHSMCDVIHHRGPDEAGYFLDGPVALGMRRLKIIDLSSGSQPIYNEDQSLVVVFNGEIYNFLDLKKDLIQKGHQFYTQTDTEVIVHLYESYGEEFLQHLNGMFAIALWDIKAQKLILARDRMGEKPLYYTEMQGDFIFASEIKSMLCHPKFKKELSPRAVSHYFTFNYIPAPFAIYEHVYKLFPGEYLVYQNNKIEKRRYWNARYQQPGPFSQDEFCEKVRASLSHSVKNRLISDVPLGAFLSGGIDSSIMVALMSQMSNAPVKTFSIGLENDKKSELPFARSVAQKYGTDHHELIARPDALGLIDDILWAFDEPFGDSSALPTFLVSQLTKNHVTVAISGDGGDELFGGYTRYQRILDRGFMSGMPKAFRNAMSRHLGERLPFGFKGKAFLEGLKYDDYAFFSIGTRETILRELFTLEFSTQAKNASPYDVAESVLLEDQALLNQCMYFDMKVYMPDDILTKVDRMSMANSLETRAPFLDHHLVELAMTIPPEMKVTGHSTKDILKKAFHKMLPEEVFTHQKTGFSIPLNDWYRGALKPLLMETLSEKRIADNGILNPAFVQKVIAQHLSGERQYERLLWMMLMFQLWYETWFLKTHPKIEAVASKHSCP